MINDQNYQNGFSNEKSNAQMYLIFNLHDLSFIIWVVVLRVWLVIYYYLYYLIFLGISIFLGKKFHRNVYFQKTKTRRKRVLAWMIYMKCNVCNVLRIRWLSVHYNDKKTFWVFIQLWARCDLLPTIFLP